MSLDFNEILKLQTAIQEIATQTHSYLLNNAKRLQYDKEHLNKGKDFWNNVIFSDKSRSETILNQYVQDFLLLVRLY